MYFSNVTNTENFENIIYLIGIGLAINLQDFYILLSNDEPAVIKHLANYIHILLY